MKNTMDLQVLSTLNPKSWPDYNYDVLCNEDKQKLIICEVINYGIPNNDFMT